MTVRDLTRPVEAGMPTYPGDPPVRVDDHATFDGDGYRVSALELGSHTGTHVDAPSHTEPDGRTLGSFPVEAFRFEARRIDCRGLAPRAPVTPDALPPASEAVDLLVFDTGWADCWGMPGTVDHPYLARETAARCAARGCHVATDALSVDPTPDDGGPGDVAGDDGPGGEDEPDGVPAHHALLGDERLILENLCNLGGVPDRFTLHAYPLALDADGAPVRAVAVWE
ncbi:MAG: cyclase family protein [Haloferacaceae archaeon]